MSERAIRNKKVLQGVVVSDRMQKSVIVEVERLVMEPRFKKYIRKRGRFMADDPKSSCKLGDIVEIIETRPLSKRKRWRVRRILASGEIYKGVNSGVER